MAKIDKPIINSLLDTDKYKYTMLYVFFSRFSNVLSRYSFKNRSSYNLLPYMDEIKDHVKHLCSLSLESKELGFLKERNPYFSVAFIEFLRHFKLNYDYIDIREKEGRLHIGTQPDSPLIYTSPFETFVLGIAQEVYTRNEYPNMDYSEGRRRLDDKIKKGNAFFRNVSTFTFADFVTRRRPSFDWHEEMLLALKAGFPSNCFVGTSNLHFSMKHDLLDIGTMAHEYEMLGQGLQGVNLKDSVKYMLQVWSEVYRGRLGIALSDVVGFDAFLRDFDLYFAKLFDGCRHDSGDPFWWCEKLINHYEQLGLSPTSKTAVFSDSVTFELMFKLIERFRNQIKLSFGIGNHLGFDLGPLYVALQMVMKLVEVNGNPVAKISDSKGKGMCEDAEHETHVKKVFQINH